MRGLLIAALLVGAAIPLLYPSASATPAPETAPQTLIVDVLGFRFNGSQGNWLVTLNVSFEASPSDPENGTWKYALNGTPDTAVCPESYCYIDGAPHHAIPIPNRPHWYWLDLPPQILGNEDSGVLSRWAIRALSIYAVPPDGGRGSSSCIIPVDLKTASLFFGQFQVVEEPTMDVLFPQTPASTVTMGDTYHACGRSAFLAPPAGVRGNVATPFGPLPTDGSKAAFSWLPSPDDNATSPHFDYYWFRSGTAPGESRFECATLANVLTVTTAAFLTFDPTWVTDYLTACEANAPHCDAGLAVAIECGHFISRGFSNLALNTVSRLNATYTSYQNDPSTAVAVPIYVRIVARDNSTHQQSDYSCMVRVNLGNVASYDGCGGLAPLGVPDDGVPRFPGLDIPDIAPRLGLDMWGLALLLGAILVGIFAWWGYDTGGRSGALIMGVVGFGLTVTFGLIARWVLVLIFMLACGAVVARLDRGGGSS